ncbi:hypothetical protein AB0J82_23670 [Asanoa sp. NPDC049518]|uniref:hypothetical protein n=1 Tax=unclassified Asanoa TaxID=2685164 RepID=UPI00341A575C
MSELAPGPDRARPPGTVRISSYLLYAVAAIEVVSLLVTLATLSSLRQALTDAYAGTELAESGDTVALVVAVGGSIVALLVAIGLVVLGFLNMRGKNAARIVTWVVGGLFLLCCGAGQALNAAGSSMGADTSGANVPDQADVQAKIDAAMPGWYNPVNTVLAIVPILLVLVALILLALPASNQWFKPRAAAWEPPTPGYPVMPGSSYPTPQFPQQAGEPPLPPAPPVQGGEPPETPAPPR